MATLARVILAIVVASPLAAGQEIQPKFVLSGHKCSLWGLAFSPDGKRLATAGSTERTIRFWDTATGAALEKKVFPKHTEPGKLAFTPDGKALVLCYSYPVPRVVSYTPGFDAVEIVDLTTGAEQVVLKVEDPGNLNDFRFSPDGQTLAILTEGESSDRKDQWEVQAHFWDVGAGKMKNRIAIGGPVRARDLGFSPNGSTLACCTGNGIVLLDTAASKVRAELWHPKWHPWSLSFSPDGKWLASAAGEKEILIWDLGNYRPSRTIGGFPKAWQVAYSPDGKMLMVTCDELKLHVLDTATYERHVSVAVHRSGIMLLAFSPNGKSLATAHADGKLKLWETAAFARLLEAQKPQAEGNAAKSLDPRIDPAHRGQRVKLQKGKTLNIQAIRGRLDRPITMKFPQGIPLETFISEIIRATRGPGDEGVPVYIEPIGLLVADRTMESPVTIDADRVPLKQVLSRALRPIGLDHAVLDGVLAISAPDELEELADAKPAARDATPGTRAIMVLLERPVALDYPSPTPLEEVLADIRQATKAAGAGFPIRVSPKGLQNADKTIASPVMITLQGASLGASLHLLLAQLGLGYSVADGTLVVSDRATLEGGAHE
jgi:WD40 repeat protein